MKRPLYTALIISLLVATSAFARIATFDSASQTVEMPCVRLNVSGVNSHECYPFTLRLVGMGLQVVGAETPFVADYETTDQIFYTENSYLNVPYVQIGDQGFSAQLSFDAQTAMLTLNNVGAPTATPGNDDSGTSGNEDDGGSTTTGSYGSCSASYGGLGGCAEYTMAVPDSVIAACEEAGGLWTEGGTCPSGYSFACIDSDYTGFNDYTYGISGSYILETLAAECRAEGGTPLMP